MVNSYASNNRTASAEIERDEFASAWSARSRQHACIMYVCMLPTAGREFPDIDLDTREVDITSLLCRHEPVFAISELPVFV